MVIYNKKNYGRKLAVIPHDKIIHAERTVGPLSQKNNRRFLNDCTNKQLKLFVQYCNIKKKKRKKKNGKKNVMPAIS